MEEVNAINRLFEKLRREGKIWRYNWSIGFRNGDLGGASSIWEDETLKKSTRLNKAPSFLRHAIKKTKRRKS